MDTLGERIQKLRKKNNLNQKEMADKMKIKQSSLSSMENNKALPSLETVISLCKGLEVDANWLLTGVEGVKISKDESVLINKYRKLTEREKGQIDFLLNQLQEDKKDDDTKKSSTFPDTG